jgi:hypothetical protein
MHIWVKIEVGEDEFSMRDTGRRKTSAKSLIERAAQTVFARVTKDKQDVHGNNPI